MKIEISKEDYQELRQLLKEILNFNRKGTRMSVVKTYNDSIPQRLLNTRKANIDDYLEFNRQDLFQICDLLNMSDIYLNQNRKKLEE